MRRGISGAVEARVQPGSDRASSRMMTKSRAGARAAVGACDSDLLVKTAGNVAVVVRHHIGCPRAVCALALMGTVIEGCRRRRHCRNKSLTR